MRIFISSLSAIARSGAAVMGSGCNAGDQPFHCAIYQTGAGFSLN